MLYDTQATFANAIIRYCLNKSNYNEFVVLIKIEDEDDVSDKIERRYAVLCSEDDLLAYHTLKLVSKELQKYINSYSNEKTISLSVGISNSKSPRVSTKRFELKYQNIDDLYDYISKRATTA